MLRPLLLQSEIALAWSRSGRWTPLALASALGDAHVSVKQSLRARHFMYTAQGRADILRDAADETQVELLRASDFFAGLDQVSPHRYFTSPVEQLDAVASTQLLEDATGWDCLTCRTAPAGGVRPWLQLWAGTAAACTQAHYDVADNVFVQCSGTKEFLLYPPRAAEKMHFYPDAHPRARKAQLCVEHPDLARHPRAAALPPPVRVVLEPGDALFLPAFYIHHVTALTPSVSLNVFSESAIKLAAGVPLALPPPLHAAWPLELRRRGLAELLSQLLHGLGMPPLSAVVADLLASRFAPLDDCLASHVAPADGAAGHRRQRRPPQAPSWDELRPALTAHCEECLECFAQLRQVVHEASHPLREPVHNHQFEMSPLIRDEAQCDGSEIHYSAVRDLTVAHLIELLSVRLFGAVHMQEELKRMIDT
ncbi:hypothetical protein AB1Y20_001086 [Prymnesium parvum]|uniref:JmjC domain-containing protein n=1 Tax=Prymnesium parvum TaxID=97485 RepID=A0AB34KCJ6_PRYPA